MTLLYLTRLLHALFAAVMLLFLVIVIIVVIIIIIIVVVLGRKVTCNLVERRNKCQTDERV